MRGNGVPKGALVAAFARGPKEVKFHQSPPKSFSHRPPRGHTLGRHPPHPMTTLRACLITLGFALLQAGATASSSAESGRPLARSFGPAEGHSKGPVVAFAETDDGTLFVGSNHLVMFDGLRWQRIDIPGAYAFRALAAAADDPNRVWVGAAGAIGYVEREPSGLWLFHSLSAPLRAAGVSEAGEIGFVKTVGTDAVFVSNQRILRWNGRRFEVWTLPSRSRLKAAGNRHSLWIFQEDKGLYRMDDHSSPRLVLPAVALGPSSPTWLLPPAETDSARPDAEGMLIGTEDAVYQVSGGSLAPLPDLSAAIAGQQPSFAADIGSDQIAIGTTKNGVVLAKRSGELLTVVNHANSLADDAVSGLWGDRRGAVWVGLNDGCARLDSVGVVSLFDRREGLERGLPRKVFSRHGSAYVLTDRVLYEVGETAQGARLKGIDTGSGPWSDALATEDEIWISGLTGLRRMGAGQATHLPAGLLAQVPWLPGGLLFTQGNALWTYAPSPARGWEARSLQFLAGEPPYSVEVSPEGTVWVAADGIYGLAPSGSADSPTLRLLLHATEGNGLPSPAPHPLLAQLGGTLFALTDNQVLSYSPSGGFAPVAALAGWTVLAAARAPDAPAVGYWLSERTGVTDSPPLDLLRVQPSGDGLTVESLRLAGLDTLGEPTCISVTPSPDGPVLWIGGTGGLLRADLARLRVAGSPRRLQMRQIRTEGKRSALLDLHPATRPVLPSDTERIEFGFSAAQPMEAAPQAVYYQTRLAGIEDDWSAPGRKNTREFTGLAPGDYVFLARRVDRHGGAGDAISYAFTLEAPWYERWPAFALYAVLFLLAGLAILRWRLRVLRLQTERLDRLVARRTRELELSHTAKSEFLETISHEIRNPLNGIVGLAALLKPERLTPEDAEVARDLKASAEHLRRVTEDVLGVSRLEFGQVRVEREPLRLGELLREVVALHQAQAKRQGNVLTVKLPDDSDDLVLGDGQKIRTIIGNFLSNALAYAPGVPIEVSADWSEEAGLCQAFIAVRDGGPGVPASEQELIFQKFVRGSAAKADKVVGSGIGLSLCRSLAQTLGGAVGVESPVAGASPGPGSRFHLFLPLERPGGQAHPSAAAPAPLAAGRLGALIVDDEPYNRTVLAGICRDLGYDPLTADTLPQAREALDSRVVAVAFLDLELRGASGIEVARALRAQPGGDLVIMIAVTGSDSEAARLRAREAGMDEFMLKPVSAEQVAKVIAQTRRGPWKALALHATGEAGTQAQALERLVGAIEGEQRSLSAAWGSLDRQALREAAHRLRTLCALVNKRELNDAAARLQDDALTAPAEEVSAQVDLLSRALDSLLAALRRKPSSRS